MQKLSQAEFLRSKVVDDLHGGVLDAAAVLAERNSHGVVEQ
ncbi:hypothetical protein AB0K16_42625 [Nonomuraea jabiensis]